MKRLIIPVFFFLVFQFGYSQQMAIFGAVISADNGRPVSGVKVIWLEVKMKRKTGELVFAESKYKTKTNEKGEYMLTITTFQENKIRFRKDGYTTVEIDVGNRKRIDISMKLKESP